MCSLRFISSLSFSVSAQVGYDLTAGLPGHSGVVTVTALGGEHNMSVVSLQSGDLLPGLFIELDGEAYEIDAVDSMNQTFTLVEVFSCSYVEQLLLLLSLLGYCRRWVEQ